MRRNDELEAKCLDMEDKVRLVLQNHKMVQESLARSYGYNRIELWPAEIDLHFEKELYERMMSQLYEEPQYIAALLRRAEPAEVDQLVEVVVNQLYALGRVSDWAPQTRSPTQLTHPAPHPSAGTPTSSAASRARRHVVFPAPVPPTTSAREKEVELAA